MSDVTDERINTATIRLAPTGPEGDTDLSDGVDTAGRVAVDGSATGEIDYGGDRDWFAVELEAGHTYRFDLEGAPTGAGTLSDPYLRGIHDASGNLIGGTADNNRGQGRNARGTFTADRSGTYYVSAGAWGNREGTYKLTVTDQTAVDAHTEDAATTGTVAVDGSATGEIDYGGDRDWFAVELEAGHTYRFDLEGASTGAGTLSDPYLRGIHDASGNLIGGTADNNRGEGRNARKTFTADRSGTYYVSAGAWGNREGTYKLTVTDQTAVDAHTEDAATTGTVAVDGSATGEIDYGGDRDWFAVELEAGHTYRFDLEGASTGAGTLSDPYLRGIHDASGNLIGGTADNNRGEGRNARKTFTADRSGTYYVSAGAWGNREGTYKLTVTDVNVNVTDVDEAPAFAEARYDFELAENADGSSARVALGTVSATDPEGSSLTYSIVHGNDADLFEIDAATGALSYKGTGEDYESGTTSHELTVRTSDGGLHSDVAVTVTPTYEAPAFAETSYAFALEENADGSETGVALGTVSAADPEGLAPTYSIVGGTESSGSRTPAFAGHDDAFALEENADGSETGVRWAVGGGPRGLGADVQHRGRHRIGAVRNRRGHGGAVLHRHGRGRVGDDELRADGACEHRRSVQRRGGHGQRHQRTRRRPSPRRATPSRWRRIDAATGALSYADGSETGVAGWTPRAWRRLQHRHGVGAVRTPSPTLGARTYSI